MSLAAAHLETALRPQIPAPPDSASFLRKIAGVTVGRPDQDVEGGTRVLPLRLAGIDELLPDGGLPLGAVVELAAPYGLGRATSLALAACASAQAEAKLRGGEGTAGAWCAWIDPTAETSDKVVGPPPTSLFAPAAARAGVDLARLLVVRPTFEALARVAVRTAQSRVFSVIVVDLVGVPGRRSGQDTRLDRWVNPVRRLAMAVAGMDTTVILLTDALASRPLPLPVALRLELERAAADRLLVSVAKDRRGRVSSPRSLAMAAG